MNFYIKNDIYKYLIWFYLSFPAININAKAVSDDELKSVVGEVHKIGVGEYTNPTIKLVEFGNIGSVTTSNSGSFVFPPSIVYNKGNSISYKVGYTLKDKGNGIIEYANYYNDGSYFIIQINTKGVFKD